MEFKEMNGLFLWKKVENFSSETKQSMNLLSLINLPYVTLFTTMCKKNSNFQTMNLYSLVWPAQAKVCTFLTRM